MRNYDAVLVFHTNALACGVTKFSEQLARRLGVPCESLGLGGNYRYPLISIKASEIGPLWQSLIPAHGDLLLHDRPSRLPSNLRIFYADEIGAPPTIEGNATRGRFRVLAFGYAHKLLLPHFVALKVRLDSEHPDYSVELSTGIHEGQSWDEGFQQSIHAMREIFGDKLRVLGFLGDDAIAKELREVNAIAVYFTPALRRNNTTYWTALQSGKIIFTNRDHDSPSDGEMPTWESVIAQLGAAEPIRDVMVSR